MSEPTERDILDALMPPERYAADASHPRVGAAKASDAGVKYDSDGTATVTLPWTEDVLGNEGDFERAVEGFKPGLLLPGYRLRLIEAKHEIRSDPAAWHRDAQGEDAVTRPIERVIWRYSFKVERIPGGADIDAVAILTKLRAVDPAEFTSMRIAGDDAFVLSVNDTQFGKSENGGTERTLDRLRWCIDAAKVRIQDLWNIGRNLGQLVIILGGDIVEGCEIFPNQSYSVDLDMRDQETIAVTAILFVLDELAPLFDQVTVLAVGGNHGERRIGGKKVNRTDNSDLKVAEMVAIAAGRDDKLGHVRFVIAKSEPIKAIEVCGHVLATTHGDAYGKAVAGVIETKVYRWKTGRAGNRLPGGDADVLITHHYHHKASKNFGSWEWHQTDALDGASMHFTDGTAQWSRPGMLTFVMTPRLRYTDELILQPPYANAELGIDLP